MAYFKLSLLTKAYDQENVNKYIKNIISEFYGNNVVEELKKYEKENNLTAVLNSKFSNVYTKTYTYNEKLTLHQQGQSELSFSLDKMILDDDTWKDNPFASKIKTGSQLLLEDKYGNMYLFTVKGITYTITENNIVYNFTCQDSFSYQLAKQNDGYTINNDINSKNFIGALSVDYWADKIVEECKIAYKYLHLETPLYLCTDGTAINTILKKSNTKQILKVLKNNYLKTEENEDLYETIPFSCSSTTANGALISLGEQIGLALKTATVLLEPEDNSNFISLITYFWFEPAKQDVVNGIQYSPFRNVKTFNLSQAGDSLITMLNINSRTLSSGELVTALPTVSPFFINYFNSTYWKKYSQYYQDMYTNALYGPQFGIDSSSNGINYNPSEFEQKGIVIEHSGDKLFFRAKITDIEKNLFSLYNIQVYQSQKTHSSIVYIDNIGDKHSADSDVANFSTTINGNVLTITVETPSFIDLATNDYIEEYEIHVFFKTQYNDEDETFAKIADQLPWLQNKLIDFSYFIRNGLLSKIQEKDIKSRLYNDLRKVNSDIMLNSAAYYSRIHAQTKYLSDMTNNIDMVGAELSNIASNYEQKGSDSHYSSANLIQRWSLLQANVSGMTDAEKTDISGSYLATGFVDLYDTVSDYMRKFLNARQRCLKNLYNFSNYFYAPIDNVYKECWKVTATIIDTDDTTAFNIYRFAPSNKDTYEVLDMTFAKKYPNFFVFDKDYTELDAKVIDYNNIRLYNNNTQHSLFDKENYLITADNYQDMNIHCYQDILHQSGSQDKYDKDREYLRQVFFLRVDDVINYLNATSAQKTEIRKKVTANSFHLHIVTTHEDSIDVDTELYPCHLQLYNKDTNYLIGWKLYEDGYDFDGRRIWILSDSYVEIDNVKYYRQAGDPFSMLDKPRYVGQHVSAADSAQDSIKFTNADGICEGPIFYQAISTSQILKNYIYRNKASLQPKVKKTYTYQPLSTLLSGNSVSSASCYDISDAHPYESRGVNFIGWGEYTDDVVKNWHIACGVMGIFIPALWIGSLITSFNLTDKMLVHGGYGNTSTHYIGTYTNFAPYSNIPTKKASVYIKEYPLDAIYYRADNNTYTKHTLVTNTNYTNFYCRVNNKNSTESFSLARNGTFMNLSRNFHVAKTEDELYTDFVSDFPSRYFYSTKPLNTTSVSYNTEGVALTFGNLIKNSSVFGGSSYFYRQTKTYQTILYNQIASLPNSAQILVFKDTTNYSVPTTSGVANNLNQYRDYEIIKKGKIQSKAEVLKEYPNIPSNVYFWKITDGVLNNISGTVEQQINTIFSEDITDSNGIIYDIDSLYNAAGIVENLYYIEERVKLSPASLSDGYSIKDHLLDNIYEFYNEREERVYTINQLFGNLTYKTPQSYTYYTFDKTISQSVRLYQYNNESVVPNIITYELDGSQNGIHINDPNSLYADFKYSITTSNVTTNVNTNGELWYEYTVKETSQDKLPLREYAALVESNLQMYWNEAYAASLLCDIFVPEEWRTQKDKAINHFNVVINTANSVSLNPVYIPEVTKTNEAQYTITWSDTVPAAENSELYTYDQLSDKWKIEVNKMLERTQNVSTDYLYFVKIADNISFYTIKDGGSNWASFINQAVGISMPDYTGWNGVAITYLTSHFVDAGTSNYELLLQKRDDLWRSFYEEYPYLFLETSYSNDSATTSEGLLTMAKYAFEDQKYPEKSYSISLIDLVQDVETLDNNNGTYNPKYYRGPELHIGEGIKISAEDYTNDRDDIYEALSQLLFITDISRDLRNDGDCQLTVNTIKYQDKLIRRLAKLIRNNPLH